MQVVIFNNLFQWEWRRGGLELPKVRQCLEPSRHCGPWDKACSRNERRARPLPRTLGGPGRRHGKTASSKSLPSPTSQASPYWSLWNKPWTETPGGASAEETAMWRGKPQLGSIVVDMVDGLKFACTNLSSQQQKRRKAHSVCIQRKWWKNWLGQAFFLTEILEANWGS